MIQDVEKWAPTATQQPVTKNVIRKPANHNRWSSLNSNDRSSPLRIHYLQHTTHAHFDRLLQSPSTHSTSSVSKASELQMEPSPVCQWLDPGQKPFNTSQCHVGRISDKERNYKGNNEVLAVSEPTGWVCATCGKLNRVGNRGNCNLCIVCGRSKEGAKLGVSKVTAVDMARAGVQQGKEKDSKSRTRGRVVDLMDNTDSKPMSNWKTFQRARRKTDKATTDHMSLSKEIHKLIREVKG